MPNNSKETDDMRDEYDFAAMLCGVRGRYAHEFENNAVTVLLNSGVAKVLFEAGDQLVCSQFHLS